MRLIAGLGNPGKRYINTRHNIGFSVIDELAKRHKVKLKKKLFGNVRQAQVTISNEKIILVQPQAFMNLQGPSLAKYVNRFKIPLEDILVLCDDINLPLGEIRIREKGRSGGHNGLESVIESLKTEIFPRLRIGIKTETQISDLSDHVLSNFDKDQMQDVKKMIARAADACESWVKDSIGKTMSLYNKIKNQK